MTSAFVFLYLLQESELDLLGKEDNDTDIEQYIITRKGAVIPQLLLSLNVVDAWECLQVEINATRRGKEWILG